MSRIQYLLIYDTIRQVLRQDTFDDVQLKHVKAAARVAFAWIYREFSMHNSHSEKFQVNGIAYPQKFRSDEHQRIDTYLLWL